MIFYGRSIDTFEAAIAMLFNRENAIRHIDCLSGRAFSLCRNNSELLYSCTLSDENAVSNINKYFGTILSVVSPIGLTSPFVIQVHDCLGMPMIIRKYYPEGHYICCKIVEKNIIINDPDGFPQLLFDIDEIDLEEQTAIVKQSNPEVVNVDYFQVMNDMLRVGREDNFPDGKPNRIFLQYAIRNYLCQTSKVIKLLHETTGLTQTNYLMFMDLFADMITQKTIKDLLEIDLKIWSSIGEIWYSKN